MKTIIELSGQVAKATGAHAQAIALQEELRAQFEQEKLTLSPPDYAVAAARLQQQAQIVAAASVERDTALAELNRAQKAEAEREQRARDTQELADLNVHARALSEEIDRLNAEARAIPARLQATHAGHSRALKRIGELTAKLNPSPPAQMASWYSEDGSLANRLAEAVSQ